MKRIVIALVAAAAITATVGTGSAYADGGTCVVRVTWQVRPCHAPTYFSKKQDYKCRKQSTPSKVESKTFKVKNADQCKQVARKMGKLVRDTIVTSDYCKAHPGHQVAMIWYGSFQGKRVLDETSKARAVPGGGINRMAMCPKKK